MSPEKTAHYTATRDYLAKTLKADTTEQTKLTIRDVNKSTKLGIVGLQPTDKKEIEGPMKLGDKNVTLFIAGLSSDYDKAVQNMRRGVEGVVGQFGSDIQDTKIFGSSEKYAFDFDETLVTGADILDANGNPDIPRYGDFEAVRESMKNAELTQLGKKLRKLMAEDPSFVKKSRILTARPQETAGILAETLQRLELPFQASDITGVSKPIGGGKLDIVDETTKRINNTTIAKAKAQDVKELEALIDDNLQNVTETRKAGKKAFQYTELKDLTPQEKAASGFPNIEGAITQSVMTVLGATGGLIQNGAVDYENGLGPAAQYFPGIGSDWPTEVKRTLDSNAISDAKKEFTRYYKENGNKGILAEAFANGGEVQTFMAGGAAKKAAFNVGDKVRSIEEWGLDHEDDPAYTVLGINKDGSLKLSDPNSDDTWTAQADMIERYARGGAVQNFMAGGAATKSRKPKEPFGTGETEFPTRISKKYAEEQYSASENLRSKLAWEKNPKDERIMVDEDKVQEAYQQPFDREKFTASFKEKISRDSLFERMSDFAKFVGLPQEDLTTALPLQLDFGASKRGGGLGMFAAAQFEKGATGIRPYEGYDLSKSGYGEKQKQEVYGLEKLITAKEKEIAKIVKTPTQTFDDGSFSFDREAYSKANDELAEFKNRSFKLKDLKRDAEKAALAEQSATSSATGRGTISFAPSMGYSSDTKNSTLYHEMTHQLFQGLRTKSAGSFDKYRDRVSSLFAGDNDDLADAFDSLTAGGGYSSADVVYGRSYKSNNLSQILSSYYRQNLDFSRSTDTIPQDTTKNLASLSNQSTAAKRAREYRPINPKVNEALLQAGDKFGMTQEKINRMEDNGKEEFLTTLMENAPRLDSKLQPILDSTLTELLSGAGIQRQKFGIGGEVDQTQPKLIQRGGFKYNLEDIVKAGFTEDQFMKQIPAPGGYGEQWQIGGYGEGSIPMPESLKPYKAPQSAIQDRVAAAQITRQDRIADALMKDGRTVRDYEGRTRDEKEWRKNRGYNLGGLIQKFAVGGVAEPEQKKEKQYGKIGLTEDGTMLNAGYFRNDTRAGYATAYKMRDYLYYVGLSSATSGYGPKLYDVLMEAATEKGAMLTSDRSMVSGDAKNVWEYYFNNRPDVQKTPLKPSDWTRNNALIDPKLYGREETWPPANDPAWILQSGYSKSPSLINSKDVIRSSTKVDSRALMNSFFSAKRGSSEPVVASNSNGEEFTVGYSKMATGGKVDSGIDKYKQILSSILPPEFLSDEGLLRDKTGKSEEIEILAPKKKSFLGSLFSGASKDNTPSASYDGALAYKALRHNLEKNKDQLDPKEYEKLKKYVDGSLAFHGGHDVVDVRKSSHRGALAHESFHDIQGFLYDNYPEIVDKIFSSIDKNKPQVEDWYHNFANKAYTGPGQYGLSHFFPDPDKEAPHVNKAFLNESMEALIRNKKTKTSETTSIAAVKTVDTSSLDLGRNELLPVLLSAASEGDTKAAEILSNIFGSAGLNKDFYKTLPRFATGGVVPGVGNSDTVPAMLNAGDFVIKKSSVNSIGTDKLAAMAGYADGGSVSDKVPALLTPGEFVFSRSSAEKIGYNKLHSINNLGKFANGGMVGGRLALGGGGEANPFFELAQRFFDHLNEVDSRKLPIKPGQNTSTSVSLDGSTIDMVKELAVAIESLGIKSSDTAVLLRRGGDISYKAAQEAYEADLQRLKLSSASTEQIIKAENTLTQIREKSLRVTNNRALIESSLFNSKTGNDEGFGAAQQKVLLEADKIEASIQKQKEKAFAKTLNTPSGGMFGASQSDLSQAAKTLASTPEEKKDTKDTAFLSAMQKTTGINKSEFANAGLSGSDIRAYMAQSSLDRKTLAEMDKQLIRSKLDEVKNSQQFGSLSLSEQKRRLDEVRELTQKEVATRREILNEIAKSQGLPSLSQKDFGSNIADFFKSPTGMYLSGTIGLAPSLANSLSPAPTNTGSAVARAATMGGSQTLAAGLQLAGSAGPAAPLVLLGTAAASLAIAFKEARNTFIDFEKQLLGKQLQLSINNLQQSFADLAKDISDLGIRDNIARYLQSGVSTADKTVDMDKNYARSFMTNLLDAATSSNQNAASDRSRILERFGSSAYLSTTTMGTGSPATAENNRKLYTERLIPERAQENAKQYSDVAQFAQKSLETMIQGGKSFDEIKASPEYDDIAASLAKANIKVQEQILAIENNNIENTAAAKANRESAKSAVIKAFADDQAAKITKNFVREREAELASRESKTFNMSFDRMFTNMNQSIETTNYSLSKFSETVEASISAMSGQAKLGTTNLDSINTLKNLNVSTPEQKETAINQASSLFGSEKGLVSSILSLGDTLESSIMTAINKTIKDNPGVSDTKVSMEIEKVIGSRLSETKLPPDLIDQLSKQINSAVETIRKKEGADTKSRRIDFSELIANAPALGETFGTLKNTQNAVIASLENWKNRLDAYSKSLDRAADIQLEAAQRRNKAEDILVNGSIELSRAFGADADPASAARLRDSRTARLTGGPTSVSDIVGGLQSLEQTRDNQRGNLTSLKNSTVGQTGSVQAIMDNERALSKTNYQINQTYAALKNLAESSEAASVAMNAVQSAQQKQAGKVSLLEKLIGSTPEELFNFNNALRRLQLTASGQPLGQTADQRKEVLSVMNDILPLLGNGQEANNLKASTLENLLKDSGVGVNIEFSKIISAIRNPEADPATKLAVEQLKQANDKQAEANRALAGLGDNIAAKMIESSAAILRSALTDTKVSFNDKQLNDILEGLRNVSTVVKPGEPDRKASGGIIYASAGSMVDFSPKGTDTVPAMLTPGEFVINRSATQKHLPLLQNINSGTYANGGSVRYYADGGYVSSALKPEYKDGINLKKSGKLSTQYEYPDISSLEELKKNSVYFYTLKNLSKMPLPPSVPEILNLPSSGSGPNRDTKEYGLKSEFGVGFPSMGSMSIDTAKEDKKSRVNFNRGPSEQASFRPVGRFIDPGSEIFKKTMRTKKLEFDQPEDNAIIQRDLFKDLLTNIGNEDLIPRKISTSKNPKITSGSGDFDIIPLSESNQLKTELPVTVSMNREYSSSLGSRFKIFFSNLSDLIPQDIGMLNSKDDLFGAVTDWTKLQGVSKDTKSLLDFFFTGSSVATKTFTDIGNNNSFTNPLTSAPTNAGNIRSGITSESSNLEALANITKTIHDAQDNISKDKAFVEPDSDKRLKASLGFLRNLYQKTSVSEVVDSDLFDLRSLGATQDKIRVFSADETTWNAKYLEAINSSIKSSKDKSLESLSYWGKPGAPFTSFSVYPEGGANTRLLPWADAGVPISEDVNAMMQREVDTNIKNIIPDTSTTTKQHNFRFKKGPILSQDVSIPYQLDFTKYLNRYWDPDIDALSDEQILDGKPIYLLNPAKNAPENPFKSLPLGDSRRLFATESALMDNTIGNNIFSQLSSDNTFLEYLSAVINDGYTSEKATKLENPAIEKFQNILSVADKVGILDKISPLKDQRGELFVKNNDMFGGPAIKVNLRDFLQSSAKKLSLDKTAAKENNANKQFSSTLDKYDLDRDGKLSQEEKDEAKKDGVDVDRKSYFERSEYPGAALAMILGSQELFGPGGQYELPGVLGNSWFTPTIDNAYGSIYDVPNDRIKSYMAQLASHLSDRFAAVDQSATYAAQSDPGLYDSIKTAKSYMLGANEAFTKLSSGDTSSIVDFFPAGIFKNQTPNGDPAANKAAIEMFATLGRVSDSSPITNAMIATGLSVDDQKEFSDKLENSMIAKISSKGDISWTKFSPDDLKNANRAGPDFKQIFDLALNPYSQFANRGVRESLLDEFINAIPQARNTDGLPLFTPTTGPEYDKSLRLMRNWYGGDGQVSVPLRSWPGVDYLYDQSIMDPAGEPIPFSTKFQELTANLDEQLYADAITANNYIGGQKAFGDLPSIRSYEGKEPQYKNKGGIVYASSGGSFVNFKPKGPDVIPAMLSDGEFVVNAKQTAQHLPLLKAINDGDAINSPIGFQDGGMAGARPFGTPLMTGNSRPNSRARTISQARANRMRDIGFSSRLTDREIDPSNGDISWSPMFDGDSYKKTKGSIQEAFARMASTNKPESFDNYQSTTKFFQDLRVSFEKEKSKKDTKIEDYRKAQRFISGLEKEYLLASRGGGINLFSNDGIFKDKGLEYDDISDKVLSLRDEADKQFEKDPKERAKRMKGLETMEKNLRIAKIGTPPRLSEKGMDPATGALSFTPGIKDKDNNFESTSKVQSDFTDMAGRGQESRLSYDEYKVKLDNIRDLRSELKTKVDDMDAAAYGRSASYLDSLERELELSARGGGLGVKSKPDMYKPRPYLSTAKQRISVMNKPGEINDQFLDPKTGKITWPLALTDSNLDDTRKKVDTIYSELMTSDNSNMSYEDFAEKRQELQNLTEEFKENVNKYKSGNYGEAKSFLDALTNNFNNVGNKGKDKANTDWRSTGDPKGVSVNASFLAPDGSISWPSAILRDPVFSKYRAAIEDDMKNAADLDGAKFDPKQSSSFKDFMDELKDKQEDFGGFDGEHYQARSFIEGLQRSYNNAGQGKPFGGMTLSDYKTQQAEKQEQERQQRQEQERQEGVDFRRRYPVQMLSSSPEADKSKIDKTADSMTYSSMASMMGEPPVSAPEAGYQNNTLGVIDAAIAQTQLNQQKAAAAPPETKPFKPPKPTAAGLERERQRNLDLEYEARAERTKERVLANVEKEGAWDVDAYDAAYRRVIRSGTPTKERWKAAQYREAVEKELSGMSPEYAQRQWKGVTPSTHYTQSPEYKAQQEKKQKRRDIRGPYTPGFAGEMDKAADEFKVGVAQASTIPIRTAAAVSDALLEISLPPDYSKQKRAVGEVRAKDQERATAITPEENSRLSEQRRRVAVGADRDMFGANVGDKAYAKFLKLSPEDQKEYLSLRERAQKGMSPTEYTRLDYLQKTLEVPYQQKQFIPKAYESDAVVPTAAKKNASLADQMRDIPKKMPILPFGDNRIPLIGSRQDTKQLPGAFEEGATFGTVFTKGVAPYVQKTEEAVQGADKATKEVAIGTGKVLAGSGRVGAGATSYMMAKSAGNYFDAFDLPDYAAGARAFEKSSDEFAQMGLEQIKEGAAGGVGNRISPEFYANEEKKSARIYQKLNLKREKESEELLPGYGAAIYAGSENLTTNAATVAAELAVTEVAFKYGKMAINAIPDAPPAKTFTPQDNAARAVSNQQLDDVFTGKRRIVRPSIDLDPKFNEFLKRPMFGENPPPLPDPALDKFLGRSSQTTPTQLPTTGPAKLSMPPKPSTWTNGVQPLPSQTEQRLAQSQREIQDLLEEVSRTESKTASLPVGTRGKTHWSIDSKTGKLSQDIQLDSGLSETDRAIIAKHELTHAARNAAGYRMSTGQLSQDSVAQLPESMTKFAEESFTIRTRYEAMKAAGQKIPAELEKLNAQFHLLEEEMAYGVAGQANAANPALRTSGSVDKYRALVKQIEESMSSPATSSGVQQATSPSWKELMEFPNGRPKPEGFYNLRLSTPDSIRGPSWGGGATYDGRQSIRGELTDFNADPNRFLPILQDTPEINKLLSMESSDSYSSKAIKYMEATTRDSLRADTVSTYDPEAIDYKGSALTAAKIVGAATVGGGIMGTYGPGKKEPQKKALGGFVRKYATGGRVAPSFEKSPYAEGTDTVPAMLSEGEFVVNARATAQHLPLLEKLNKGGLAYLAGGSLDLVKSGTDTAINGTKVVSDVASGNVGLDTLSAGFSGTKSALELVGASPYTREIGGIGEDALGILSATGTLLNPEASTFDKVKAAGSGTQKTASLVGNLGKAKYVVPEALLKQAGPLAGKVATGGAAALELGVGAYKGYSDQEAIDRGVSAPVRIGLGAISGSASSGGSVTQKMTGINMSESTDEYTAAGEAALRGGSVGAMMGSVVPVVGTAIGGAAGAAVGLSSETLKVGNETGMMVYDNAYGKTAQNIKRLEGQLTARRNGDKFMKTLGLASGGLVYLSEGSKEPLAYKELKGLAQAQQDYQQSTFGEYLPTWMGGVQKPERTLSKEEQGRLWKEEEKRKVPVFSRLGDAGTDMWKRKEVKGDTQAEVAANHAQEMKMHEEALFEEKKKGPSITRFISDASKAAGSKTEELTGSKLLGTAVGVTTGIAGAITDPSTVMTLVATGGLGYLPAMGVESGSAMMGAGIAKAAGDDVGTKEAIIQSIASVAVPVGLRTAFEYGPAAIQAGRRLTGDVASLGGRIERPSLLPLVTESEQALAGSRLQSDMAKKGQQLIHATPNPFAFAEGAELIPNTRPGATPFIKLPGAAGMKAAEIEAAVPDSIFADGARPTSKGLQGHASPLGDASYFAYAEGDQFQAGFDDSFRYSLEKAKTSADLSKATLIPAGLPQSHMDEVLSTPAFGTGHGTPARKSLESLAQTRGVSVDSNMTIGQLSNANIIAMRAQKVSPEGIRASLNVNNHPGVSFSNTSIRGETVPGMGVAISKDAPITYGNIAGPIDKNMSSSARTIAELTRAEPINFHNIAGAPGIELTGRIASEQAGASVLISHGGGHDKPHEPPHSTLTYNLFDNNSSSKKEPSYYQLGGLIYASAGAFMPKGKDTIPAMLTPGEFVVNSEAAQKNSSLLQDINSGSIQYASNGALIGTKSKNIDTRPSENERSVLGAIGTGYYSRGGIVEYLNYGGRANSQFIGEPPIASGNALYRPENERTQYQTMTYAAPAQDNIVNQSTNMATQSGVLNNNTNMQSSSGGGGFGGMDISGIQKVFENFRQDLTVLQESVSQFSTGAEAVASSASQYKEFGNNLTNSSDKLANLSLPDQLNVNVTSNLDKLGASVTSEISGTIMRSNQGLVNNLQNYSDSGDKAIAKKGFNDSEGALRLG